MEYTKEQSNLPTIQPPPPHTQKNPSEPPNPTKPPKPFKSYKTLQTISNFVFFFEEIVFTVCVK